MTNIIIGGNICPMGRVERFFTAGNASAIFHDLLDEIASADLSVANLECPLISQKTPLIKGAGPVLDADIGCVRGFAASKWTLLNLANNHSFDHGTSELQETMHAVRHARMSVVGAGLNLHEAQAPYTTQISGQKNRYLRDGRA